MSGTLLLVNDKILERVKTKIYLEDAPGVDCVVECDSAREAIAKMADGDIYAIVVAMPIVDLSLDLFAHAVCRSSPSAKLVILFDPQKPGAIASTLGVTAEAYCGSADSPARLHALMSALEEGCIWLDPQIARAVLSMEAQQGQFLSEEQRAMLNLISSGKNGKALAVARQESTGELASQLRSLLDTIAREGVTDTLPVVLTGTPEEVARTTKRVCLSCSEEFETSLTKCPADGSKLIEVGKKTERLVSLPDGYGTLEFVEEGAMAAVYKAHSPDGKMVAVKILHEELLVEESAQERFEQESKILKRLNHPNIVRFLDAGVASSGQPFIVMEYCAGKSLENHLAARGSIPLNRAIPIFIQICDALEHAHSMDIIHRDLSPWNIMIASQDPDAVKLIDFGLAKLIRKVDRTVKRLTRTGWICGTPSYLSPEQCQGAAMDHRADIYSLGCLMYEVVSGVPPLMGENISETINNHLYTVPRELSSLEPSLNPAFSKLVMDCIQKDPDKRPARAARVREALRNC